MTFTTPGTHTVRLRVTDAGLATGTASRPILVDDALPTPVIDTPTAALTWRVGDTINFTGHATDGQGAALPASGLSWSLGLQHCPSNCHPHGLQSWTGVASGSFAAPDHDYPSYLELTLTATDSLGRQASTTLRLDPRTVDLTFQTVPTGLSLAVGTQPEQAAPFTRRVIVGSSQGLSAASPQTLSGTTYVFGSWSDGGAATHPITAPATAATYTATYTLAPPGTTSYLSDLAYTVTSNGWGPAEKDRSNGEQAAGDGRPITLNGTVYAKGLGVHAVSDIRYTMSNCTSFTASVGVDDEVPTNRGSIVFQVWLDGVVAFDSGTMTGATATRAVSVNTTGKTALRLVVAVGPGGIDYGHGDWADARLTCGGAPVDTTPPTVTSFTPANGATGQPTGTAPTAVFSEAIDQATLTTTTFSVTDQTTATAVPGAVGYDGANRRATFTPTSPLAFSRTYLVRVRGGADRHRGHRRDPPRGGRDLDVHHGRGARHHAADGDRVHAGQRRDRAVHGDRAHRHVLRGDQPGHAHDDHVQPDRPDDRWPRSRARSRTTPPTGGRRSPRPPRSSPGGPTRPASSVARPAWPTWRASAWWPT